VADERQETTYVPEETANNPQETINLLPDAT
jgi:hypothetical protein